MEKIFFGIILFVSFFYVEVGCSGEYATDDELAKKSLPSTTLEADGYATLNGGTTGGEGGMVVFARTGTEIHEALCNRKSNDTPVIMLIGLIYKGL